MIDPRARRAGTKDAAVATRISLAKMAMSFDIMHLRPGNSDAASAQSAGRCASVAQGCKGIRQGVGLPANGGLCKVASVGGTGKQRARQT